MVLGLRPLQALVPADRLCMGSRGDSLGANTSLGPGMEIWGRERGRKRLIPPPRSSLPFRMPMGRCNAQLLSQRGPCSWELRSDVPRKDKMEEGTQKVRR